MAHPKICLSGRSIFLLSGYEDLAAPSSRHGHTVVTEKHKLRLAVELNPDAVAFGYLAGEWFPAA